MEESTKSVFRLYLWEISKMGAGVAEHATSKCGFFWAEGSWDPADLGLSSPFVIQKNVDGSLYQEESYLLYLKDISARQARHLPKICSSSENHHLFELSAPPTLLNSRWYRLACEPGTCMCASFVFLLLIYLISIQSLDQLKHLGGKKALHPLKFIHHFTLQSDDIGTWLGQEGGSLRTGLVFL